MSNTDSPEDGIDWNLTSWEGSRREALRRWSRLPLEKIIAALEEMEQFNAALSETWVQEQSEEYKTTKK